MGSGGSSNNSRQVRDYYVAHDYSSVKDGNVERIYSDTVREAMDPARCKLPREACDSPACPNSVGVILAFDDTSSMNRLLTDLVKTQMKDIAVRVPNSVSYDPQLLFASINDVRAWCDTPLQIGQFEAEFEPMIDQLTGLHIQGGGGGNGSESYIIVHYFGAKYTRLESLEKHGRKGVMFVIGDDGPTPDLTQSERKTTFGKNDDPDIRGKLTAHEVLEMAEEKFHVYQIIVHGSTYDRYVVSDWKQLLGGHALDISDHACIPDLVIAILRMYDGKTKEEAISMISNERTRRIVSQAMADHEEVAEPEAAPTVTGEIEDF